MPLNNKGWYAIKPIKVGMPLNKTELNMISKHFIDNILKLAWAHFLHTVKWFHLFRSKIILSIIHHLFAHSQMFSSIAI